MKLQDFHVEVADWSNQDQRGALLAIRDEVFIREQGVSEAREHDGLDDQCWHVLARDYDGHPIGCGRLTPEHKIGRMAVTREWRGRGVGAAVLRELVSRARDLGWLEVALAAQVSAISFYERQGFSAYGEVFEDAGMAHRCMTLALPPRDKIVAPLRDTGALSAGNPTETAAARLQLLTQTQRELSIYLVTLDQHAYASPDELAELRRIGSSGRGARIRIILHDPATALRTDHRIVTLAQRLPSSIQIRTPIEEADLAYPSNYLLNDGGGYLFVPDANRAQGRAASHDRAAQAPLSRHFNNVWERSERASVLQTLDL
ncbi:MAG: GNAT family N-acetyltransferase [Rhodanobacter sp.]